MSANQKDVGSSLTLTNFSSACNFGFVRLFFRKFFNVSKGSSLQFFDILQQNGRSKIPKGPLLHFLALCDLPETSKKFRKKGRYFFLIFSLFRHIATF